MRKGELTRLEILETALPLASRMGLTGLSIGVLAEALGMSKSGLFAHFRSKQALEIALVDHAAALFVERVVRPTLKAPRGVPRIEALLDNWLLWFEHEMVHGGCFFAAAAFELDDRPGPVRERVLGQQRDFLEFVATVVRTGVAEGHLRSDTDVEQFAHDLFGILLATQHYARFLQDSTAGARARRSLGALIAASRPGNRA